MLFTVASILVACTASEERSLLKRHLITPREPLQKVLDFLDNKLPVDLDGSGLVKNIKAWKLGDQAIGDWVAKGLAITVFGTWPAQLVLAILNEFFLSAESNLQGWEYSMAYTSFGCMLAMDGFGAYKMQKNRKAYIMVGGAVALAWGLYSAVYHNVMGFTGESAGTHKILRLVVTAVGLTVVLFNWLKTLLPVLLKFFE